MFIVQLLGGLGNQLFQYCFGQRLAYEHSVSVCYDSRLLRDHSRGRHAVARDYALDVFSAEVHEAPFTMALRYSAEGLPRMVRGVLRGAGITRANARVLERRFGFDAAYLKVQPPAYLAGLWQSVEYIAPIEQKLRDALRFRERIAAGSQELAKKLADAGSVCVHVRRTDYLLQQQSESSLGFVGVEYYRRALAELQSAENGLRFFVFSDDIEWCQKELRFIPDAEFVDQSHAGYKDGGHLQLMSMANHFIIPNSTFSWWAAWLGGRAGKRVVLPERWFRDPLLDSSGFCLPGCQRV